MNNRNRAHEDIGKALDLIKHELENFISLGKKPDHWKPCKSICGMIDHLVALHGFYLPRIYSRVITNTLFDMGLTTGRWYPVSDPNSLLTPEEQFDDCVDNDSMYEGVYLELRLAYAKLIVEHIEKGSFVSVLREEIVY